jgi:hypothetical protein
MSWLQVFRSVDTALRGPRIRFQHLPRAVRQEKWGGLRASAEHRQALIATFFGRCTAGSLSVRISVFFHHLKRLER